MNLNSKHGNHVREELTWNLRNHASKATNSKICDGDLNRVQWTKEFMDKVRKSNERVKLKDSKCHKISDMTTVTKQPTDQVSVYTLQDGRDEQPTAQGLLKGDGIQLQPDNYDMNDIEELDYEDNLSVDGDVEIRDIEEEIQLEKTTPVVCKEPQPRSSSGNN